MQKQLLEAIQAHAAEVYPRECCGLVLKIGRKQRYLPCENTAAQATEEFCIAPGAYAAAEDQGEIIAVVHSHPDATSRPSPRDLAMCEASGLPWHILSWPEGDLRTIVPAGSTPLLGRPFVHGAWDCWQVCADWYQREMGVEFPAYDREDGWWERADGPSHYEDRYADAGFVRVDQPKRGDLVVMTIGRTVHPNHAGIYLGSDPGLPGEDSAVHGAGPFLLHHLYGRPSEIIIYGGPWFDRTRLVLRQISSV
ncbi:MULTISPECIES: C40 family peptidase [unclassified Pseudomonas]|uniref:C40 family peptidase n=1 Tax=unclassified Pseudomonas TaxID=196821 RepID=UPI000BC78168|nr:MULTISPECIES: C40 family peptidase [unclassified Pseudomonas]PVZ19917.1 proteasome lid subunit RPN8/RPN11 [Pseudomonas sp. URIL14HWK12:I12]PVZ26983.1 proteasome lid subunit RPN8/RPN11 [Pseudomonas sp. URIL14HWK12:I10]PVZ37872.1 proteasome lid subunit RPN8/RPN11 [Pseudomonas sp. URIL14HWK12:I11]SNZ05330.1 Proteasome lid subunit RPN8/RPN11, contains Jab1/MPN metalloenzyme (JAMM) motif [Pseudomonas sp. URIL14HWK12:I9]